MENNKKIVMTRLEAVNWLLEKDMESLDRGYIRHLLANGCIGYNELSDYELEYALTERGYVININDISICEDLSMLYVGPFNE